MKEQLVTWTAQAHRAEARSKQFLTLVEGTADAAFAIDVRGRICAWNSGATDLFGLTEAEAINVRCHDILQCSDENRVICSQYCIVERAAQDNRARVNFDLRVQTKSGKLWCSLSTLLANDPVSGAVYAIYLVFPIETRKRLEQALSEFVRRHARTGLNRSPMIRLAPAPRVEARLTSREVEVLKSLANGYSTRAIAHQLNISSATVNNHIKHILAKLGAHTRLEAIRHAEGTGVI